MRFFDVFTFSPQLIQARWQFDELPSEEAPIIGIDALELGFDGKYIRRLAGLIRPTTSEVDPLMPGFLNELGVTTTVQRTEAGMTLALFVAEAIADGQLEPFTGAIYIWVHIVNQMYPKPPLELLPFVGAASEYEDAEWSNPPDEGRRKLVGSRRLKSSQSTFPVAATNDWLNEELIADDIS